MFKRRLFSISNSLAAFYIYLSIPQSNNLSTRVIQKVLCLIQLSDLSHTLSLVYVSPARKLKQKSELAFLALKEVTVCCYDKSNQLRLFFLGEAKKIVNDSCINLLLSMRLFKKVFSMVLITDGNKLNRSLLRHRKKSYAIVKEYGVGKL